MRLALTVAATLLATVSVAQADHDHDHDHAEHEHGLGRLDVTVAGSQLRLDLTLTGRDLFGKDEAASLEGAREMLRDTASFVSVPEAAGCEMAATDVAETVIEEEGEHEGHRDYTAYHVLDCASPDALDGITVTAFETVDGLEEIHAAARVDGREMAERDLTPGEATLDLTETAEVRRELGAHEHGASALDVAIVEGRVEMRLESPAMDIVGFEHEPSTDEQRAAIEEARATLSDPLTLFAPPEAAGCAVAEAAVEHVFEDGHDDHGHDDHGAEGHSHDDHAEEATAEEDHDHGAEEAAADDHGHEEGATHSEFQATYALDCEDPSALTAIDFPFFETFPNAQEVDVQVVTERGQTGAEVERDSPRLDLGEVL